MSSVQPFDPIAAFCAGCRENLDELPVELVRNTLFWQPAIPEPFIESHSVCDYCLDFYRVNGPLHRTTCALERADLELATVGWASPYSIGLRLELRRNETPWAAITARLLRDSLHGRQLSGFAVVAIPMSSEHGQGLEPVAQQLADSMDLGYLQVITRERGASARQSGRHARRRIAEDEYQIVSATDIRGRQIILLDDNVTTGETMACVATTLISAGATQVLPVSIDRTISTRFGQRLAQLRPLGCGHDLD